MFGNLDKRISRNGMNPILFIVLGLIVAGLPLLGFPPATEDVMISAVGLIIALCAAISFWWGRRGRQSQKYSEDTTE